MTQLRFLVTSLSLLIAGGHVAAQSLTATRELRIANTVDLNNITDMRVLKDGAIVIAQAADGELRYYDPAGKPTGKFGRKGEGPGEFMRIARIGVIGDSVWGYDQATRRITVIGPDRKLVRTVLIPMLSGTSPGLSYPAERVGWGSAPLAYYSNGDILLGGTPKSAADRPALSKVLPENHLPTGRFSPAGMLRAAPFSRASQTPGCSTPFGNTSIGPPECPRSETIISDDGAWFAEAIPTSITPKNGKYTYKVRVLNSAGKVVWGQDLVLEGKPLSSKQVDSIRSGLVTNAKDPNVAAAYRRITIPNVKVPLSSLLIGRDGSLWVRLRGNSYMVFSPIGTSLGSFQLPTNVVLWAATAGTAWGTETDDDGLPSLVRYSIRGSK